MSDSTVCPSCSRVIDGKTVYPAWGTGLCRMCDLLSSGGSTAVGVNPACWPMLSDALAVHPSQAQAATDRNRKHGVPVSYDPKDGRAIIPDAGAYKKLRRLEGVHFNNSFYG